MVDGRAPPVAFRLQQAVIRIAEVSTAIVQAWQPVTSITGNVALATKVRPAETGLARGSALHPSWRSWQARSARVRS